MKRLGLIAFTLVVATSRALAAPAVEAHAVAGLEKPAEIRVDLWGIPHIYAGSVRDAFFLQGYNVARDRCGRWTCGASGAWACSPRTSGRITWPRTGRRVCSSIAAT